jgi:hypothetical protein
VNKHLLHIMFEKHAMHTIHKEHALVEIYNHTEAKSENSLLELEYHSPYTTLQPGDSMQAWQVWEIYDFTQEHTRTNHIASINTI